MKPLIEHLEELRYRLIAVLVSVALFFVIGVVSSRWIIERLRHDIVVYPGIQIIVLTPLEYFVTTLKIGLFVAIILSLPVIMYQALKFLKPALTRKEKGIISLVMPGSIILFLAGLVFAYFIFLPLTVYFLAPFSLSIGASNMWSLNSLITFIFITLFSTALVFEIPLLMIVLSRLGVVTTKWLNAKRKYVYVGIFVVAAIITPGVDIITQIIVALPMILLYELGILLIKS